MPSAADRASNERHLLEALTVALEAMKLAVEAANEAPRRISHEQPALSQVFENWAAANLLVSQVFDTLHRQVRHAIEAIKPILATTSE